jgi:hypothetical protein
MSPSAKTRVDGFPREVWINEFGDELIESYTIANMAHGMPLAVGEAEGACGAPGPFLLSVGISSSYHIAKFFGIAVARPQAERNISAERNLPQISTSPRLYQEAEPALDGEILDKDDDVFREHQPKPHVEIGAVINKALRAAGLIKE